MQQRQLWRAKFVTVGLAAVAWASIATLAHAAGTAPTFEQRQAEIVAAFYAEKYDEGEKLARALIADVEAGSGPSSPEIWEPLNLLAVILNQRGALADAEALWRRVVKLRTDNKDSPPAELSMIYNNLGANLTAQGRFVEADEQLLKAVKLFVASPGGAEDLAKLYNSTAMNAKASGDFAGAAKFFQKSIETAQQAPGDNRLLMAELYDNLGVALSNQGKFGEAEATIRKALALWKETLGENSLGMSRGYGNLGLVFKDLGDLQQAETAVRKSIAIQSDLAGDAGPESYTNLALILSDQGRFGDAEPIARKAVTLSEQRFGLSHPSTASTYDNLGLILSQLDRSIECEPLNRKALAIRLALFGPDSADVALSYNNLGTTLAETGRIAEAEPMLNAALAIYRRLPGGPSTQLAATLRNSAHLFSIAGRHADAERLFREALSIRLALMGKDHLATAQSYISVAEQLNSQGKLGEAESVAAQAVDAALATKMRTRSAVQNRSIADPSANIYASYANFAWDAAAEKPAEAENLRARSFIVAQELVRSASGDAMALSSARIAAGTGPLAAIVTEQQTLSAQLVDLDQRLLTALGKQDQAIVADLRKQETAAQTRLAMLDTQIDASFPRYRALISPAPIALADVQTQLAADEGLLFLLTIDDEVYSFAVTPKASAWHRLDGATATIATQIRHLRCQVDAEHCSGAADASETAPDGQAHSRRFDLNAANQLYQLLVAPVEPALAGSKRLYVTASKGLGDLPLGMLVTARPAVDADDADVATLASAPYLSDRYALTYLPSVAGLALKTAARKTGGRTTSFDGYGDPTLNGDGSAELDRGGKYFRGVGRSGLPLADPGMIRSAPPLPGTRRELEAMAVSLGAPKTSVHLQGAATESAVKADNTLADAQVIAFATHGILPGTIRGLDEPGLILTPPAEASDMDDGVLTASEASQLQLSADWVILSACNTAATEGANGADSLSGLARGFLYAGARALLASHWAVSDDATAALTVETLTVRRAHPELTRAQAFQQAMHTIRTGKRADGSVLAGYDPGWAHPAAWAPFTHIANRDE